MRLIPLLALLLVPFSSSLSAAEPARSKVLTEFVYEQTEPLFEKRAKRFEQLIASDHTNRMLWKQLLKSQFIERDSLATWQSVIETPVTIRQLENTIHGALQFYDLPDLIDLAGPDIVTIESPRDATGNPMVTE